jgi:hypothetical protein
VIRNTVGSKGSWKGRRKYPQQISNSRPSAHTTSVCSARATESVFGIFRGRPTILVFSRTVKILFKIAKFLLYVISLTMTLVYCMSKEIYLFIYLFTLWYGGGKVGLVHTVMAYRRSTIGGKYTFSAIKICNVSNYKQIEL